MLRFLPQIGFLIVLTVLLATVAATGPGIGAGHTADGPAGTVMSAAIAVHAVGAPSHCDGSCDVAPAVCGAPCPTAFAGKAAPGPVLHGASDKLRPVPILRRGVSPSVEPEPPKALS